MFSFYSTSGVVQTMFVQYENEALRRRKKDMHLVRNEEINTIDEVMNTIDVEINTIEKKNDEDFFE